MAVPAASRLPERLRRAARPDRYPQPTEAALYFSVLEALQNVANYAHASQARVTLGQDGPSLVFTVEEADRRRVHRVRVSDETTVVTP